MGGAGITELTQDVLAGPGTGAVAATVVGLRGVTVDAAAPASGDVLSFDGSQWTPTAPFVAGATADARTLVNGNVGHLSWLVLAPTLAFAVLPAADTSGLLSWVNCTAKAPAGSYRARPFTVPAGVTSIRIEQDSVQLSLLGATGQLVLELWDAQGMSRLSQTLVDIPSSATTVATADIVVVPGTEYQVRVVVATSAGVQCSYIGGAVRVRPTVSSDPFWLTNFVRVEADGLLHGHVETPGYDSARHPRQGEYSELRLRTTAAAIVAETHCDVAGYLGSAASRYAVIVSDIGATLVTPTDCATSYATVAFTPSTSGRSVIVRSGQQVITDLPGLKVENRGTYLTAIYLDAAETLVLERPPSRVRIAVHGDSKVGAGAAVPSLSSLPAALRALGYECQTYACGGRTQAQDASTSVLQTALARRLVSAGANTIVLEAGRNDGSGGTAIATILAARAGIADAVHAAAPAASVVLLGMSKEGTAFESSAFGGSTPDAYRALDFASVSSRTSFCSYASADAAWTSTDAQTLVTTSDTTHPSTEGHRRDAETIAAVIDGRPHPFPVLSLGGSIWWEADSFTTGGAMGAVTASSGAPAVTLTGTPVTGFHLAIRIVSGGARGAAVGQWSADCGRSWWRFDTAATVVLGPTGVTAAFADAVYATGNAYSADVRVSSALDLTGGGNHVVQTVTSAQPYHQEQAINGRPGLFCDDVAPEYVHRAGLSASVYTIGVVAKATDVTGTRAVIGIPGSATGVKFYFNSGATLYANDGGAQIAATGLDLTKAFSAILVNSGVSSVFYANGVAFTGTMGNVVNTDPAWGYNNVGGAYRFKGPIAAGFYKPAAMTADQVRCLTGYWRSKYGTP